MSEYGYIKGIIHVDQGCDMVTFDIDTVASILEKHSDIEALGDDWVEFKITDTISHGKSSAVNYLEDMIKEIENHDFHVELRANRYIECDDGLLTYDSDEVYGLKDSLFE